MIIVLNNKCYLNKEEFITYQSELSDIKTSSTLILCPSIINLGQFSLDNFYLGSQNVSKYKNGAHTGEISANQLKSYNVDYCIVGHSERRKNLNESLTDINQKIKQLNAENITPILCIGESKKIENKELLKDILTKELIEIINNLTFIEKDNLIIAYEPIWSIGTNLLPTNDEIEQAISIIKNILPNSKVLYGGSVNDKNIDEIKKCSLIDGYLLGGLSLKPDKLKILLQKLEN